MRMNKMLSIITATTLATGFVASLTASAIVNPIVPGKDPNGDGRLTLADSTFIQTVLAGRYNPADLTELDVDDNGVVSMADSKYVIMDYAGAFDDPMNLENPVSPASVTPTSNTYQRREYYKFNATGSYTGYYYIDIEDSNNLPRTVFGEDNRVLDNSNKGAVKIFTDDEFFSSGFIVDAHTIATSAHCLFDTYTNTASAIDDIIVLDGNEEINFSAVEYHIPYLYIESEAYGPSYDYALITVSEDMSEYMTYSLGLLTDTAVNKNVSLTTVGYPGEVGSNHNANTYYISQRYISSGTLVSLSENGCFFGYNADTSGGNSGGVIYHEEYLNGQTYRVAVGINSGLGAINTSNYALRFTPEILKFYCINPNKSY